MFLGPSVSQQIDNQLTQAFQTRDKLAIMRLLNVHTRKFKDFISDTDIEPYATLSHTWGDEEVSFEDFQSLPVTRAKDNFMTSLWPAKSRTSLYSATLPPEVVTIRKGYKKIDYCCLQAADDGYDWAWVDTYVTRF